MRKIWILVLAMLLIAAPAQAQQDSVTVTIYNQSDLQLIITPDDFTGFVGDTVTFDAQVVDAVTGDTLSAILQWSTDDPTNVEIDPDTGFARFLARGTYRIYVDVVSIVAELIIFELDENGDARWIPESGIELAVGDSVQLCAYLFDPQMMPVGKSGEFCPDEISGVTPLVPLQYIPQLLERTAKAG